MPDLDLRQFGIDLPSLVPLQAAPETAEQIIPYLKSLHAYLGGDRAKIARAINVLAYYRAVVAQDDTIQRLVASDSKATRLNEDTGLMEYDSSVPSGLAAWNKIMAGEVYWSQFTKDPTGFVEPIAGVSGAASIDISGTNFVIEPYDTSFTFFFQGKEFVKTAQETLDISSATTEGNYAVVYNSDGDLELLDSFTLEDVIKDNVFVAGLYHDGNSLQFMYRETHGLMPWAVHALWHQTIGTTHVSGLGLENVTADGNGSLDAHAEFDAAAGVIRDEDIEHSLAAMTGNWDVLYKENGGWVFESSGSNCPVVFDTGVPQINDVSTPGSEALAGVSNNKYFLVHILATGIETDGSGTAVSGHVAVVGQNEYNSLADARVGATDEVNSLDTVGLPMPEFLFVATVIYQYSTSYSNAYDVRVRSTEEGDDYVSWLGTAITPGQPPSAHPNLTQRDLPNQHPADAISVDVTDFGGILSASDDEVQSALDTLDDHDHDGDYSALGHDHDGDYSALGHSHVETDITDLDHTDADAIHDNVAGEIAALTSVNPALADSYLIEDASNSNNKRRVTHQNVFKFNDSNTVIWITVANNTGSTIPARSLCYITGDSSGNPTVALADADAASTSTGALVLIPTAINNGATGQGVLFGVCSGFTGLTAGAVQYVSTTAGGVTQTAPSGAGDIVRVAGYAISATEIFLNPGHSWVEVA